MAILGIYVRYLSYKAPLQKNESISFFQSPFWVDDFPNFPTWDSC